VKDFIRANKDDLISLALILFGFGIMVASLGWGAIGVFLFVWGYGMQIDE